MKSSEDTVLEVEGSGMSVPKAMLRSETTTEAAASSMVMKDLLQDHTGTAVLEGLP